jgi:HEAT repeat protein
VTGSYAFVPLINLLTDENTRVRSYAADALGEIRDVVAIEPLIKAMNVHPSAYGTLVYAEALAFIGGPGVDYLIPTLKSPNANIRLNAASALKIIKDTRVVQPLVEAANDPVDEVPAEIASSLGVKRDTCAVEQLEMMQYDSNIVAIEASLGLATLAKEGVEEVFTVLIKALKNTRNIISIILALKLVGDKRAIPYLEKVVTQFEEPTAFSDGQIIPVFDVAKQAIEEI